MDQTLGDSKTARIRGTTQSMLEGLDGGLEIEATATDLVVKQKG
jgi:hypothetical protein